MRVLWTGREAAARHIQTRIRVECGRASRERRPARVIQRAAAAAKQERAATTATRRADARTEGRRGGRGSMQATAAAEGERGVAGLLLRARQRRRLLLLLLLQHGLVCPVGGGSLLLLLLLLCATPCVGCGCGLRRGDAERRLRRRCARPARTRRMLCTACETVRERMAEGQRHRLE